MQKSEPAIEDYRHALPLSTDTLQYTRCLPCFHTIFALIDNDSFTRRRTVIVISTTGRISG